MAGAVIALLLLVPVCAWAFSSPARGATCDARLSERSLASPDDSRRAWSAFSRSLPATFALNVLVLGAWLGGADSVAVLVVVLVFKDVLLEVQARRRLVDPVVVWPVHTFRLVGPVLQALRAAAVPAHLRAAHHRALGHFFAPHLPMEVLVAGADATRARAIVAAVIARAEAQPHAPDRAEHLQHSSAS